MIHNINEMLLFISVSLESFSIELLGRGVATLGGFGAEGEIDLVGVCSAVTSSGDWADLGPRYLSEP